MMEALVTRGPLGVDFEVKADFRLYESGIYQFIGAKADFDPFVVSTYHSFILDFDILKFDKIESM